MATTPNAMMGQVAPGAPSNLSPSVIAQLQQDMMGMPLDQLQQYAQKHMDDPIYGPTVVSMASYVANMKKAAQVPTTSPNQPTVAQQAVQSIAPPPPPMQAPPQSVPLPENQGIGQLPAKNIESMAGGGIVGYAGGGEVKHFDGSQNSLVPLTNQSLLGDVPIYTNSPLLPQQGAPENNQVPLLRQLGSLSTRNMYGANAAPLPSNPVMASRAPNPVTPAATTAPAMSAAAMAAPPSEASNASPTPTAPAPAAAPAVDPNAPNPYSPNMGGAGVGGGGFKFNSAGLDAIYKNMGINNKTLTEITNNLKDSGLLPQQEDNSPNSAIKAVRDAQKAMGYDPTNKKVYERLDEMDKKAQDLSDKQSALAIIQGGLSMIRAGNPWEAIAKGAGVGVSSYGDAQEKLAKAQEQHGLARIAADQAANSMAHGDADTALKQMDEVANRNLKGKELGLNAGVSLLNANQQARTAVTDALMGAQASTQNAATSAAATLQASKNVINAPLYQAAEFGAAKPGSALYAGHVMQRAEAMAGPLAEKYAAYAAGEKTMGREPMSFDEYAANATRAVGIMSGTVQPVDQHALALAWLKANPNDKMAPAVRAKLGLPNG